MDLKLADPQLHIHQTQFFNGAATNSKHWVQTSCRVEIVADSTCLWLMAKCQPGSLLSRLLVCCDIWHAPAAITTSGSIDNPPRCCHTRVICLRFHKICQEAACWAAATSSFHAQQGQTINCRPGGALNTWWLARGSHRTGRDTSPELTHMVRPGGHQSTAIVELTSWQGGGLLDSLSPVSPAA